MFQPLHLALASPGTTEKMSPLRPPRSVFHRSTFASLLGQAGLHVACMALVVKLAQAHSPEVRITVVEFLARVGRWLCLTSLVLVGFVVLL